MACARDESPLLSSFVRIPQPLPGTYAVAQDLLHGLSLLACLFTPLPCSEGLRRFAPVLSPRIHRICGLRSGATNAAADFSLPELVGLIDRVGHAVFTHSRYSQPVFDHPVAVTATHPSGNILQ